MTVLGMLNLSHRPYRFCPECGFPVGRNSRRDTLGVHSGRDRHSLCKGHRVSWKVLQVPTREQWEAYWRRTEAQRIAACGRILAPLAALLTGCTNHDFVFSCGLMSGLTVGCVVTCFALLVLDRGEG